MEDMFVGGTWTWAWLQYERMWYIILYFVRLIYCNHGRDMCWLIIYVICCWDSSSSTLCGQRPVCEWLVRYVSPTETCIHVLICICWIKVLCPTGKERMIILNMYIYTSIVISTYHRVILSRQQLSLIKWYHICWIRSL